MELNMWKPVTVTDHHPGGKGQDCGGLSPPQVPFSLPVCGEQLTTAYAWGASKIEAAVIYSLNLRDRFCFLLLLSWAWTSCFSLFLRGCSSGRTNGTCSLLNLCLILDVLKFSSGIPAGGAQLVTCWEHPALQKEISLIGSTLWCKYFCCGQVQATAWCHWTWSWEEMCTTGFGKLPLAYHWLYHKFC